MIKKNYISLSQPTLKTRNKDAFLLFNHLIPFSHPYMQYILLLKVNMDKKNHLLCNLKRQVIALKMQL